MFYKGIVEDIVYKYNTIKHIYIGSYFCSQYFLNIDFIDHIKSFCIAHNYSIVLVIPIISEKDLWKAKDKIRDLIQNIPINEITVNDFGMAEYIFENYSIPINFGRLFFKDARDIRILDYYKSELTPAFLDVISIYKDLYCLNGIELDPIAQGLNLIEIDGVQISLHEPFCYLTTGNICKFASTSKQISKKFRPNLPCNNTCLQVFETYEQVNHMIPEKRFYRIGRTIYFHTESPAIHCNQPIHKIYFPFEELMCLIKERVMKQ